MEIIHRNSGATIITDVVAKIGGEVVGNQGRYMRDNPGFIKVLDAWDSGYIMPKLQKVGVATDMEADAALRALLRIWRRSRRSTAGTIGILEDYLAYVASIKAHPALHDFVERHTGSLLQDWGGGDLHIVASIHGDATLENVGFYHGDAVWFDPSLRIVPTVAEMDAGKLLQSVYGYHGAQRDEVIQEVMRFVIAHTNVQASVIFFVTHLIRLWHLQPHRQEWALGCLERTVLIHG